MRPFDVQSRLSFPALARIGPWQSRSAVLIDDFEAWRCSNSEFGIKGGQIGGNGWIIVGVNNRNRLSAAIGCRGTERSLAEPIRWLICAGV